VVDMQNFNTITIDSTTNIATIGTGNRLGDIATALNNAGRALPHGTCAYVGIGGHSGYGGFGFTSRMWGLTLDTINAINVVLADGTVVRATSSTDSDLFWGLRGSSGSLGIVVSIEVNTFPAPSSATTFEYTWTMNVAAASNAISAFQSFVQTNIPPQFGAEINLSKGSSSGTVTLSLTGGWYGDASDLQATLQPFLSQLPSNPGQITTGTYIQSVEYFAGGSLDTSAPDIHDTFYAKSMMTPASTPMTLSAITSFITYLADDGFSSSLDWFVQFELYGGTNSAINAVASSATAFVHRSSIFTLQLYASSGGPPFPQDGITFVDDMVTSLTSCMPDDWNYGAYPNYVDDQLTNWQTLYYGDNYAQLQAAKDKYDPLDLFQFPTSVAE